MSSGWMFLFLKACSLSGWKWLTLKSLMNLSYLGLFCGLALRGRVEWLLTMSFSSKAQGVWRARSSLAGGSCFNLCFQRQLLIWDVYLGFPRAHLPFTPFHVRNPCNIWYPCTAFGNVGINLSVIQLPLTQAGESTSGTAYGN